MFEKFGHVVKDQVEVQTAWWQRKRLGFGSEGPSHQPAAVMEMVKETKAAVTQRRKSIQGLHKPCHLFSRVAAARRKPRASREPSTGAVRKTEAE